MALIARMRSRTCRRKDWLQSSEMWPYAACPVALAGSPFATGLSELSGHEIPK